MSATKQPTVCAQCGRPQPPGHTRYCSKGCKLKRKRLRWRANRSAASRPYVYRPPRPRWGPHEKFAAATAPDKRVAVPEAPEVQRKAELLIERGCCAYRNRRGLIRDIGVPRKPEHRGRVWAVEAVR